jgi:hypothetical protein
MAESEIEDLARTFHAVYQGQARRNAEAGHEKPRHPDAYDDLPEHVKEYDRALARYVLEQYGGLEASATRVLAWLSAIDPTWADRLRVLKEERGFTELQALGSCIAWVCDNEQHMVIPNRDEFLSGATGALPHPCPVCDHEFTPSYPGQPVCSNDCAAAYYAQAKVG